MLTTIALTFLALASDDSKDDAARKYLARRLEVAPLRVTTVTTNQYGGVVNASSVDTWTVYQGQNSMVTARGLAEMVNDTETLKKMQTERAIGMGVGIPLTLAGLGLAGYGIYYSTNNLMADDSTGWLLAGALGGGTLMGVGIVTWMGPAGKQRWPVRYYSEEQATGMVDDYNEQLLSDLGVSKDEVLQYLKSRGAIELTVQPLFAGNMIGVAGTF